MDDGIGAEKTRDDHPALARQLYACCARVARARALDALIGREDLSAVDRRYLDFGEAFEKKLLDQGRDEHRPIARTLDLAWEVLGKLPESELSRIPRVLLGRRRAR